MLPSLCSRPKNPKEATLHSLDVVRALRVYLSATAPFRKSDSLFVSVNGPKKGMAVTISRWIRQVVPQAYALKGRAPPFQVTAHSTRAIGASWAFLHQASVLQVCKAATWSSIHTFKILQGGCECIFGCLLQPQGVTGSSLRLEFLR